MQNELAFIVEKMNITKVDMLLPSLNNKEKYVMHIWVLKQALKNGLVL